MRSSASRLFVAYCNGDRYATIQVPVLDAQQQEFFVKLEEMTE